MLSEDFGGEWSDNPPPIWERLARAAKDNHDKLALACLHQPSDLYGINNSGRSYLNWSYHDLITAVDLVSSGLQAQGVGAGSTLACFLGNGAEFVLLFWAAHKLGCTFVPLNARALQNTEESQHVLTLANVSAVVVGDAVFPASMFRSSLRTALVKRSLPGWSGFCCCWALPTVLGVGSEFCLP